MSDAITQFWTDYGDLTSGAFMALSVIVLLWALITAFWSLNRTMNEALKLWDESERALHRFKTVVANLEDAEAGLAERNSRKAK